MRRRKTVCLPKTINVLALFLLCGTSVLCLCFSSAIYGQEEKLTDSQVNQLVNDLGSEIYAIRQHASEQIWQLGPLAKPALKLAADKNDSEVAKRAQAILDVFELGIDAETNPEVAQLVWRFNSSGKSVRSNILRNLVREDRFELAFKLFEQIEKSQQRTVFREIMSLDDTLIRLARADRWDDFVFLFSHPTTFEHDRTVTLFYHLANNTLDELLDNLKSEMLEKEKDGKKLDTTELMSLVSILRLTGKYEDAEAFANKIPEATKKFPSLHLLWMEQGQWDKVAKVMISKDVPARPEDGKLVATEPQRAYVYYLTGDTQAYQEVIDGLNKKRKELKELNSKDKTGVEEIRKSLIHIGMATTNWELVESNLDLEDKTTAFEILDYTRRTDRGLELLDLGTNVDERNRWFNRRLRTIRSLNAKVERLESQEQDTEEVEEELAETWNLCFDIADKLQLLGFDNEAALHFTNLFSAMGESESYSRRARVVSGLMKLERYDEVWKVIERGFTVRELNNLHYTLFPNKASQARYWWGHLTKHYRNPTQRLKAVSGILNSPLGTLPDLNIDQELSRIRVDETHNRIGYVDYQTHLVYLYHQKPELSERYRQMAGELGYHIVQKNIALDDLKSNNLDKALEYFDNTWKQRTAPVEALYAAEVYRKKGNDKESMLRNCLAYAFWRDSYRNTSTINSLKTENRTDLVEGFINIDLCSYYRNKISNERYRLTLADAQAESKPYKSMLNRRIAMFNMCANTSSQFPSTLAYQAIQSNLAASRFLIAENKFDEALKVLLRINNFAPGDPGTGEKLIAELDKAGGVEQADQLFKAIAEPYFEMIAKYPDSPSYRNDYAWVCACANRRTEHMLRHIEIAHSKRSNFSNYVDTLAEINFLLGNKDEAIELARRCISLDPTKAHYKQQLDRFLGKATQN